MAARRDPVDRVLDLIVAIPVCSLVAARRSVPIVSRVVRSALAAAGSPDLPASLSHGGLGDVRDTGPAAPSGRAVPPGPTPSTESGDFVEAVDADVVEVADLPIADYDHLAARQILDRLPALDADELARVAEYERTHRARSTVLGRLEQLGA